jgi:hypothetical protein
MAVGSVTDVRCDDSSIRKGGVKETGAGWWSVGRRRGTMVVAGRGGS